MDIVATEHEIHRIFPSMPFNVTAVFSSLILLNSIEPILRFIDTNKKERKKTHNARRFISNVLFMLLEAITNRFGILCTW